MKTTITNKGLKEKVNSNIQSLIVNENYEVKSELAINLLTPERFDLIAKYIYAKYKLEKINSIFGEEIYSEHIKVLNNFVENDESKKIGRKAFFESFNNIIDSIKSDGLYEGTVIPVNDSNLVLDGAHRVSCSIFLEKKIDIVQLNYNNSNFKFDYKFFKKRGLSLKYLDAMALEYSKLKPNTRLILVWPRAKGKDDDLLDVLERFGKIVYRKDIKMTSQGLVNLVLNAYKDEPWVGNYKNNFEGVRNKAFMCFEESNPLRVFLFESTEDLVLMKSEIRDIFKVEKHALHINDTHEETIEIGNLVFNENSILNLNSSRIKEFKKFNLLFYQYIEWLKKSDFKEDNFILIGGVLSTFGLLQSSDLDFISSEDNAPDFINENIEKEQSKLNYIKINKTEIIYNPKYYFYYRNQKFVCLDLIKEIKKIRGNLNDIKQVELIDQIFKNGIVKITLTSKLKELVKMSFYKRNLKMIMLKLRYYLYKFKNSCFAK